MPAQLKRLLILFAVFIVLFLIARHFLVPDSFGEYGHYRGDALKDNSEKEQVYATQSECYDCHSDIKEMLDSDMHAGISCLSCHGPGLEHIDNMEASSIEKHTSREFCGRCHALNPARSIDVIAQVDIYTHNIDREHCIDCHNPHQVWELKE